MAAAGLTGSKHSLTLSGNAPTGFAELSRAFDPRSVLQKWGDTTIVCSARIRVDKKPLSGEEGKVRDTRVVKAGISL